MREGKSKVSAGFQSQHFYLATTAISEPWKKSNNYSRYIH